MNKRIGVVLIAFILAFTSIFGMGVTSNTAKAETKLKVRLHYYRSDGVYDGWNIWSWPSGGEGSGYTFTGEDDFGKVAEYDIVIGDNVTEIGFILRLSTSDNEWAEKDTPNDRFMDVTKAKDGVLDVYVVSGQESFDYTKEGVYSQKISSAKVIDETTIKFQLSKETDKDLLAVTKITDGSGNVHNIKGIEVSKTEGKITLSDSIDVTAEYTLEIEGYGAYEVLPGNIFSTDAFEAEFTYNGDDLGAIWTKEKTNFRLWAPTATSVSINLYQGGDDTQDDLIEVIPMTASEAGTWTAEKVGDLHGVYYTYSVTISDKTNEAVDPYAKSAGVNGNRGMIIDLASTNPQGWDQDKRQTLDSPTDAIIYEIHIRDLSIDESSGISNKGKYLGFIEEGTKNASGTMTGLDHMKDLGVTHVQILPSYDYGSVDESKLDTPQFNWGYDPKNYNVPEGSYSSDPYRGEVRVNEYKQMVQKLHDNGIGVIMDVVYNHTYNLDFSFNKIVPEFFYRINEDGTYSNGSGCGNDVATERAMVRKYIVDSVVYWATEYHMDGFRFDLVGLMDTETMNEIRAALDEIDPNIMIYGEGWHLSTNVTKEGVDLATQSNAALVPRLGMFSDNIRDGLKGSVFDATQKGYINGADGKVDVIKDGVLGTLTWSTGPSQAINYTSCHDNNTLWDKIASSNPEDSEEDRIKQNLLGAAVVFTAQGTPFIQAGEEMLRTKVKEDGTFDHNSYQSPDSINSMKWNLLDEYPVVNEYYKGLMAFRKAHPALRMTTAEDVKNNIKFVDGTETNVIAYEITGGANGDESKGIFVIYNPNRIETKLNLPEGNWDVYIQGNKAGTKVLSTISSSVVVEPISCTVLVLSDKPGEVVTPEVKEVVAHDEDSVEAMANNQEYDNNIIGKVAGAVFIGLVLLVGAFFVVKEHRKDKK